MYCPKCGQQQASEQARFCSRCGFQLSAVTELLVCNGAPAAMQTPASGGKLSPSRQSTRFGAKLIFLSVVIFPLMLGLGIALDTPATMLVPITFLFSGLSWIIYHRIFDTETLPEGGRRNFFNLSDSTLKRIYGQQMYEQLYGTENPVYSGKKPDTAEMEVPASVTEHTTRKLPDQRTPY